MNRVVGRYLFLAAVLSGCGSSSGRLLDDEIERSTFDTYCASYSKFPDDAKGNAIRYTIDRIKFIAGIDAPGAEGCIGITDKFRQATKRPYDPARGSEQYIVYLGARSKPGNLSFEPDLGDTFSLQELEPFTYFRFITHLYLPHGKITDISLLASITSLQVLDLRNNRIAKIGDALSVPVHLEYVDLSFNQLKSTQGIGGDFSLRYLDVSGNPELQDVSNLKTKKKLVHYYGPTLN